ncbi:MAG: prolyl oligopeptidase family serine peptidase [Planctomycetes bacterium]|nr:prolyl oligopeptidase family serine peptidase [Planctomycetota bacterium]
MLPKTSIALLLGLAALEAPAVAQQLLNRSINVQGVTRTYLVYVPSSYSAAEPAPLLFNFHGGDTTSQEMLQLSDMRDLAEADAFLLVYPQGLPEPGGGPIWNSEGPYSNGTDEMAFVGAVIDRMAADYSVDERRVYACGFSNGGNLVYDLGCLMADRFAAIAAVAGNMFEWTYTSCSPTSPTALLTIHGTADNTYNAYNGLPPFTISLPQTHTYWVGANGARSTPDVSSITPSTDRFVWPAEQGCFEVEHYRITGGGHDWPGAFGFPGPIDADEVIWDFVSRFDVDGLLTCAGPSAYCPVTPNSSGAGAEIGWSGSTSVADDDLVLEVTGVPSSTVGLFFYGPDQVQLGLGNGLRCVGGSLQRLPVVGADASGTVSYPVELLNTSLPTGAISAGETWNFQFWFRDVQAFPYRFNLSNGLRVPFTP